MATGMAIMGFDGGAMIGGPFKRFLLKKYAIAPEHLGSESELTLTTENGIRYAETAAGRQEGSDYSLCCRPDQLLWRQTRIRRLPGRDW